MLAGALGPLRTIGSLAYRHFGVLLRSKDHAAITDEDHLLGLGLLADRGAGLLLLVLNDVESVGTGCRYDHRDEGCQDCTLRNHRVPPAPLNSKKSTRVPQI